MISMEKLETGKEVIVITEMGYAKRTICSSFRTAKARGSKGVRCIPEAKASETGKVVNVLVVDNDKDDILVVADDGQTIRFPISNIPVYSRMAKGLRTIRLKNENTKITGIILTDPETEKDF